MCDVAGDEERQAHQSLSRPGVATMWALTALLMIGNVHGSATIELPTTGPHAAMLSAPGFPQAEQAGPAPDNGFSVSHSPR
jgi:hypothetical protein